MGKRILVLITIALTVAVSFWIFSFLSRYGGGDSSYKISGKVVEANGNNIAVSGRIISDLNPPGNSSSNSKEVTVILRVKGDTSLTKFLYITDKSKPIGEAYEPEMKKESGVLSDIVPGLSIIAVTKDDIWDNNQSDVLEIKYSIISSR